MNSNRTAQKRLVLLALCAAALIINVDVTIVNVALPSLVRELGATTTNLQWIVDAYTLVFAARILAAGSGVATGPVVGGWLLERFWWGSVFAFMVTLAVAVAVGVALVVPSSKDPSVPPIDWLGLALSSAAMGTLVFALIQAPDWGWGST